MGHLIDIAVFFTGFMAMSISMSPEDVVKIFEKNEIVPDLIPVAPEKLAKIKYPSNVEVMEGNELTPTLTIETPTVDWDVEDGAFYALCLSDPDSPSRVNTLYKEWLHWLVGNIPGKDIASGDYLAAYIGTGPPKDTGLHRFVFLVYKQPAKIEFTEERLSDTDASGRGGFHIAKFAEKYNLGNPVAGNFFQAGYDDYVPIVHKKLNIAQLYPV